MYLILSLNALLIRENNKIGQRRREGGFHEKNNTKQQHVEKSNATKMPICQISQPKR
jgi:hypothetical protein